MFNVHSVDSLRYLFLAQWLMCDSRQQKDENALAKKGKVRKTRPEICVDSKNAAINIVFKFMRKTSLIFSYEFIGSELDNDFYYYRIRNTCPTWAPKTPKTPTHICGISLLMNDVYAEIQSIPFSSMMFKM